MKYHHRIAKEKRIADNFKIILGLDKGLSFAAVAELLLLDDGTIRNVYARYVENGIEGISTFAYNGGLAYLSDKEQAELSTYLENNLHSFSKDIQRHVLEKYKIEYTPEGIRLLLHRLGFVYKKTKHLPGKADVEAGKLFEQAYRQLKAGKAPQDAIYFMDGVHPLHNSITACGWIKKGKEKAIKANTGRVRMNINGVCNAATADVIIHPGEVINAQSTIALFDKVKQHQPCGIIHVIADNARYYKSRLVQQYLQVQENKRINLLFLPPYSPNLNLIERLWKYFKKRVLYNKYYETEQEFRETVTTFFQNIKNYKQELLRLLKDNFYYPKTRFA